MSKEWFVAGLTKEQKTELEVIWQKNKQLRF
jgi:hypothetical protein